MGTIVNSRSGIHLFLAAALLLGGCASSIQVQREEAITAHPRTQRERLLQLEWVDQPYHSLIAAAGPPRILMRIPGDRPNEMVAVYGVRDKVSGCIDAFVVFHGYMRTAINNDSRVTNYFCR